MDAATGTATSVFGLIPSILFLVVWGVGIYCIILFIKLARRGIKALDIYLEEKTRNGL